MRLPGQKNLDPIYLKTFGPNKRKGEILVMYYIYTNRIDNHRVTKLNNQQVQ